MPDFSAQLDLPLIFAIVLALAIFLYAVLDGFDLGLGILFPFAPTDDCRSKMMNSVAPFWDGNETWLVLGGGGLLAAFPLAYAIIMPHLYVPIILMLLGLIFRGVAFEFRFKTESQKERKLWDFSFHVGSLIAAFFQGVMLGAFIQGFDLRTQSHWSWISSFSLMTGVAVIFGYALIGSTWLVMKTHGKTQEWARSCATYCLLFVLCFIVLVSVWTPLLHERILLLWFLPPNILYLAPVPLVTLTTVLLLLRALLLKKEIAPFLLTILLFTLCYIGIAVTLFPYIVPYQITFEKAAASAHSLSFLLIGVAITLPLILCYTAFSYLVFRGKSSHEKLY